MRPRSAAVWAVMIALGLCFVGAVELRYALPGVVDRGLVVVVLVASSLLAHRARGGAAAHAAGVVAAIAAAWLLPQRDDVGTALILAALFGAGLGLATSPHDAHATADRPHRKAWSRATATLLIVAIAGFVMYVGAETPSAHWFGGGITHGPRNGGAVALTFDDGPNLTATLPIMRILDAAGVKGTFFEVGHAIDKEPWITRELYDDGQELGNHSYHHDQWRWLDPRYPELQRTQLTFERAIGKCPAFYRPPHGDRTPFVAHVVNGHHMRMILWDDSAGDWAVTNPRTIARRILNGVHAGSIIVLHDGLNGNPLADRRALVRAMPLILAGLRARHLHPVRLDQLIGGPAYVRCTS